MFVQEASLLAPFVDGGGKSATWNILPNSLIVHGNMTFLQLGYSSPGSSGAIMTSHPIGSERFSIDLNIEIDEGEIRKEGDDGMAIWLSEEDVFREGTCFGRSCDFKGILVVIKTSGDSYIGVKGGNVSINPRGGASASDFDRVVYGEISYNSPFVIRILQNDYKLSVYVGKSHDDLSLVHSYGNNIVAKDYHMGISASTGSSSNTFRLHGVESYHLKTVKGRPLKDEEKSGGRLIWVLFFVVVGVTGYYLYSIQIKKGR